MFKRKREPQQPMVAVALCFVVGVAAGWHWGFDLWWLMGGVIGCVVLNFVVGWRWIAFVALLLSGAVVTTLERSGYDELPDRGLYALRVSTPRHVVVEGVRGDDGVWRGSSESLLYGCDSTLELAVGDRVVVQGVIRRYSHRGYIYISQRGVWEYRSDAELGARVNGAMARRVDRLGLSGDAEALVKGVLLGDRSDIDGGVMESYRRSGAAHLLAVSGLHVGIVASIFMLLLTPILFIYRGHIYRLLLVIVLVWGYAYVVGMSASVVRASVMFSALLLSPLTMREYNSLNILSFAVVVMVLFDPQIIFDVGFQLSVVAVVSILLWALPIWRLRGVSLRHWLCDWLLLPLLIGLCCSVATLPVISHTFGYVSLFGVLLNPLLLITTYLLLTLSLLWILFGFDLLSPLFRSAIDMCAAAQNGVVEWAAFGWRDAIDYRIESLSVVLIYALYALLTIGFSNFISARRDEK